MKLVSIPANPVPDHVVTGAIKTPDDVSLRFARFDPPPGRKGTVVLLQGRAEYIEKYFETVRDLRARGFAVATFDWRGQGLSDRGLKDRNKGHVRNFSEYATDLEAIMQQVVLPDCPPPIFALAHSMGAAIAIRACHDGSRWFERLVCCADDISADEPAHEHGRSLGALYAIARPRRPRRADRPRFGHRSRGFHRQCAHVGSGALCAQYGGARRST
jgi:alpha-beta hydrolase superfamily lysophospholipase